MLDLRITHDRFGRSSDPSLNGHLHYPNDIDNHSMRLPLTRSETPLQRSLLFTETARTVIRFRKKTKNLCVCDSEDRDGGVGVDVNDSILLMTGSDLLDGDTDTSTVSQRSESGQRILCDKEDIGKYDMWYGVVCEVVMSLCMSVGCSLARGCDIMMVTHHNLFVTTINRDWNQRSSDLHDYVYNETIK